MFGDHDSIPVAHFRLMESPSPWILPQSPQITAHRLPHSDVFRKPTFSSYVGTFVFFVLFLPCLHCLRRCEDVSTAETLLASPESCFHHLKPSKRTNANSSMLNSPTPLHASSRSCRQHADCRRSIPAKHGCQRYGGGISQRPLKTQSQTRFQTTTALTYYCLYTLQPCTRINLSVSSRATRNLLRPIYSLPMASHAQPRNLYQSSRMVQTNGSTAKHTSPILGLLPWLARNVRRRNQRSGEIC